MVETADPGVQQCIFCKNSVNRLPYENTFVTKEEIAKEYKIFLGEIKERNEILKNAARGDVEGIPTKLL